jgi:hypothetical protein
MTVMTLPCTPTDLGLIAAAIDHADSRNFDFGDLSQEDIARLRDNIEKLIDRLPAIQAAEAMMVKALGDSLLSKE